MKEYKTLFKSIVGRKIAFTSTEGILEKEINELAQENWTVKSFGTASFDIERGEPQVLVHVLLERDRNNCLSCKGDKQTNQKTVNHWDKIPTV